MNRSEIEENSTQNRREVFEMDLNESDVEDEGIQPLFEEERDQDTQELFLKIIRGHWRIVGSIENPIEDDVDSEETLEFDPSRDLINDLDEDISFYN